MANTTKKFLDSAGTSYLWGKIKAGLDAKANALDVTAINTKLGTIPNTVTQSTFADWIAAVAIAAGDATAVEALDDRVEAIEDDYLKAADKTELAGDISTNADDIDALEGLHAKVGGSGADKDNLKTVAQEVSAGIDALKLSTTYAAKSYEGKVDTLIGDDSSKSARTIASEEVAKIVANADASYDTLKEIADWILAHPTDASGYNTRLFALEGITDGIGGTDEEATVVAYVTKVINELALSTTYAAKSAETDIDNLEALHATGTHNGKATVAEEVNAGITALNLSNTYYSKTSGEANAAAITAIKDGTSIDSFKDVETALAGKQATIPENTYDAYGSAAAVLGTATDASTAATVYGAKAYANSLAKNYATAAQGTKADSALQADDVIALTNEEIETAISNAPSTT